MADTPDTPDTPPADDKPTPRRRAPRKVQSAAAEPSSEQATADKPAPRRRKATPKPEEAAPARKPVAAKPTPKPRTTKRRTAAPPPTRTQRATAAVDEATEKVGGRWGVAAIAGGLAVAGAATAALLSLRSSAPKEKGRPVTQPIAGTPTQGEPASVKAGIADENSSPA